MMMLVIVLLSPHHFDCFFSRYTWYMWVRQLSYKFFLPFSKRTVKNNWHRILKSILLFCDSSLHFHLWLYRTVFHVMDEVWMHAVLMAIFFQKLSCDCEPVPPLILLFCSLQESCWDKWWKFFLQFDCPFSGVVIRPAVSEDWRERWCTSDFGCWFWILCFGGLVGCTCVLIVIDTL